MAQRTNDEWLRDLRGSGVIRDTAIEDLRKRLQRGIQYYLAHERSDLASYAPDEITHLAEDFAQEAVLRVLDNLDSFRGDSLFTTWATKVAVRIAISELRRARYRDFSLDTLVDDGTFRESTAALINSDPPDRPERATEKSEVMAHIQQAFADALTPRQRAALEAYVLEGIPLDVIAEQLGTNRNALYKLVFDARRKLRQALTEQGLSPDYILDLFEE